MNLNKNGLTSNIRLRILRDGFEGRDDSIDDVLDLEEGNNLLKLIIGDASNFRLDVVDVLDVIP